MTLGKNVLVTTFPFVRLKVKIGLKGLCVYLSVASLSLWTICRFIINFWHNFILIRCKLIVLTVNCISVRIIEFWASCLIFVKLCVRPWAGIARPVVTGSGLELQRLDSRQRPDLLFTFTPRPFLMLTRSSSQLVQKSENNSYCVLLWT